MDPCTDPNCRCEGVLHVLGREVHVTVESPVDAALPSYLGLPNSWHEYVIRAYDLRHEEETYVPPTPLEEWMEEEEAYWYDVGQYQYMARFVDPHYDVDGWWDPMDLLD